MKHSLKTAALSFGIALLFAGVALAHGSGSGSGTKAVKLTLKGTGASAPGANTGPDGQCINTGDTSWLDGYTGTCSVPGNCSCTEVTATVSGSGLKTVANFFVTSDQGINPVTVTPVSPGPNPQCNLILGTFTVTDSSSDLTTLNFLGVSCKKLTGFSSKNPTGTENGETMSGGWGISGTPAPTKPISGWGTFTGTSNNANAVSIKLSGWITQ